MKINYKSNLIILLLVFACTMSAYSVAPDGDQIVEIIDDTYHSFTGTGIIELEIIEDDEVTRIDRLEQFVKNGEQILVRYLKPRQQEGTAYLNTADDENWLYLPNANRTVRVSSGQSFQGSHLSNDDILNLQLAADYQAEIIGEEIVDDRKALVLELTALEETATYGSLEYTVTAEDYFPLKTVYYAHSGMRLKTTYYSERELINDVKWPTRYEFVCDLQDGARTIMTIVEADYDEDVPDYYFTREFLQRGN